MSEHTAYYIPFTKAMKETHTILMPNMLPLHFRQLARVLSGAGYKVELLETQGPQIVETGLKYVQNDACYPAILVIGQFLDALMSGKYDPRRVALIYFQTGGGCRASNYISLLRKALERAGYGYVPVISFNLLGLEEHPGFRLSLGTLKRMVVGLIYADLTMLLVNQVSPYEKTPGETARTAGEMADEIARDMLKGGAMPGSMGRNMLRILNRFGAIERAQEKRIPVGVVGEIYIKYSPLGNNNLVEFLQSEGAEAVVPGLVDFCMFYLYHHLYERRLYGGHALRSLGFRAAYGLLLRVQRRMILCIRRDGRFRAPSPFPHVVERIRAYMSLGCKMGEGWLLPGEMLELYDQGVKNIVCAQPFGCLPNHICGKGMMKPFKDQYPDMNIVAVDYDPGATRVNQENRIKLMLANAKRE